MAQTRRRVNEMPADSRLVYHANMLMSLLLLLLLDFHGNARTQ